MTVGFLSNTVFRLLRGYAELLPLLPEQHRRASEAQTRKSAGALFGAGSAADWAETTRLLDGGEDDLTLNIWRLMRARERAIDRLPENRKKLAAEDAFESFLAVFRALLPVLADAGIKIVSLEGREFDPNYAVEAANISDFDDEHGLVVAEMLEPVLLRGGKPARYGKVILSQKGGNDVSGD